MIIGFICDLHLPFDTRALQYDVLEWAVKELSESCPDCIAFAGDATCDGNQASYDLFLKSIKKINIPFLYIPGNSDLRCAETRENIKLLASPCKNSVGSTEIYAVNDCDGKISAEQFSLMQQAEDDSIVFMHHPPKEHDRESADRLLHWRATHPKTKLFYAHLHCFDADGYSFSLPAMDPDKSIGEQPCILYYDTVTGQMRKVHYDIPACEDMLEYVGISCYRPHEQIRFAAANRLKYLELRPNCATVECAELLDMIAEWRALGGERLSIHLPDVGYSDGEVVFDEQYDKVLELVSVLGADRVTQHVPKVCVGMTENGSGVLEKICDAVAYKLNSISCALTVGVENMHMTSKESADANRRFGYTPEECLAFMQLLGERCHHKVGINFDIGHARNNAPYSKKYQISTWLSMLGEHIVGYHIHQVTNENGKFENHMPITQIYGSLISFASFFKSWEEQSINRAPVIFEMRPDGAYKKTLETFYQYCSAKE